MCDWYAISTGGFRQVIGVLWCARSDRTPDLLVRSQWVTGNLRLTEVLSGAHVRAFSGTSDRVCATMISAEMHSVGILLGIPDWR